MGTEKYNVVRVHQGWGVEHEGSIEGDYTTKEAAFEAIAGAASNAIKAGLGVAINVPAREPGESAIGGAV